MSNLPGSNLVVMKFGGTSVEDATAISRNCRAKAKSDSFPTGAISWEEKSI